MSSGLSLKEIDNPYGNISKFSGFNFNISPAIMLELYQSWLEAFVGALNNNFSFREIESENSLTYEIFKN